MAFWLCVEGWYASLRALMEVLTFWVTFDTAWKDKGGGQAGEVETPSDSVESTTTQLFLPFTKRIALHMIEARLK